MTPQKAENIVKIWLLVSEKFFEIEIIFSGPPLQEVRILRFYFWAIEGPQLHKKFRAPQTSSFGDMRGQRFNFPTPSPKIWVVRSPPYFAEGITGMTPKRWKFRENLAISFWEIFWNWNYSFLGPRMLRFYFFPPIPPKLGGQIPSIFCIEYTSDDLQKPWKFCESLTKSFRDIRLFTVRAYRRDTIVSSTL